MICRFIDTHCHFDFPPFSGDEEASLQRAAQAGVGKIIVPAIEAENFARVQALAEKYQPLYAALGLHPGMLEKHSDVSLDQLQQALERRPAKVVAVGEIGLDYYWLKTPEERANSRDFFDAQLSLAEELNLPAIVHDRDAHRDCLDIVRAHPKVTGVYHCYSGGVEDAKILMKLGWMISFTGSITFKNARRALEVIDLLPMDRIMIETDSPYLSPEPFRGRRNDSGRVHLVAEAIARVKGMDPEEAARITLENGTRFFRIEF